MKVLNNKGMSLIEMLVCLSLMSVVVLLMYGLISQINNLSSESNYAVKNQNIRLEIIKTIEDDLIANKLADVEKKDNDITLFFSDNDKGEIKYYQENEDYLVEYISHDSVKTKWRLKGAKIDFNNSYMCQNKIDEKSGILNINIIIKNEEGNNPLDDISLTVPIDFNYSYNC